MASMAKDGICPFKIEVTPELLENLRQRLRNTRWFYQADGEDHSNAD